MRILVIDDLKMQRDHAKAALAGHEVTTADGFEEGKKLLKMSAWDLVLTDLSMPAEWEGKWGYIGEPTPYGFPLALLALKIGVPKVAIVSNGQVDNHHDHPIFSASDYIHGEIIPGRLWAFTGNDCPHMGDSLTDIEKSWEIKDWAAVVKEVTA